MRNSGKKTEAIFDDMYKNKLGIVWYKFTDTYAARNFVQAQPADRMLVHKGQVWLVEIKSTNDIARFPLKNISKKQVGFGRYWRAAGAKEVFIIHQIPWNKFYFVPFNFIDEKFKGKKASINWDEIEVFEREVDYEFYR